MTHTEFYAAIKEFTLLLVRNEIPFSYAPFRDGGQWKFKNFEGDIAIHSGTYYCDEGYLESYRMPWDNGDVSVYYPADMVHLLLGEEPKEESPHQRIYSNLQGL